MKKTSALVLLALAAAASFVFLSAVLADSPPQNPEFYFTRLIYTQNPNSGRGRGRGFGGFGGFGRLGTMASFEYECPEFGGKPFFPPQGWGWATDAPGADCKFMGGIHRLTGLPVYTNPHFVKIMDPDLFKFPYVYIVEPGQMLINDKEASQLREFFARGGFLHVDDFWGLDQKANFEQQMRKVFPDKALEVLPLTHAVFHSFYDIDEIIQIPGEGAGCNGGRTWEQADDKEPRIYGISDDKGRLMVVVTYNSDLGDAWEYADEACYPVKFTAQAYRLGLNFMIYAMTH